MSQDIKVGDRVMPIYGASKVGTVMDVGDIEADGRYDVLVRWDGWDGPEGRAYREQGRNFWYRRLVLEPK